MYTYVVGLVLSVLICIIIEKTIGFEKKKTLKMFISLLPLTFISAVRYDVGWDFKNIYTMGFYMVGQYNIDWFTEGLFRLIIKILYNLFGEPISLFVLFSILISFVFSLCYSSYGKTKKVYAYIILFVISRYYFCSLNIMRQALAMMMILYSMQFVAKKQFLKYALVVLLAGGFHYTSYIFLPLYFILSHNYKKKSNLFLALVAIPPLLMFGMYFISSTKYVKYFATMFGNDGTIYYSEFLISGAILFIAGSMYKKVKEDKISLCMFNMEIIAFVMSIFSFMLPTGDRIIWIFSIINLFFIPNLLSMIENKRTKQFAGLIIYSILILVFCMQTIYTDSYSVIPYQNIWQK